MTQTIKFKVGDTCYEVSRSLLEALNEGGGNDKLDSSPFCGRPKWDNTERDCKVKRNKDKNIIFGILIPSIFKFYTDNHKAVRLGPKWESMVLHHDFPCYTSRKFACWFPLT